MSGVVSGCASAVMVGLSASALDLLSQCQLCGHGQDHPLLSLSVLCNHLHRLVKWPVPF